jgi:hypothetical protein
VAPVEDDAPELDGVKVVDVVAFRDADDTITVTVADSILQLLLCAKLVALAEDVVEKLAEDEVEEVVGSGSSTIWATMRTSLHWSPIQRS